MRMNGASGWPRAGCWSRWSTAGSGCSPTPTSRRGTSRWRWPPGARSRPRSELPPELPWRGDRQELEPVKAVAGQSQQVAELADRREDHPAHALDRRDAPEPAQVQLDRLREPGQVVDAQDHVGLPGFRVPGVARGMLVLADEGQHARVGGVQFLVAALPEDRMPLPDLDHPPGP